MRYSQNPILSKKPEMSRPIGKHHKLVLLPHLIKIIPNKPKEPASLPNDAKFYGFDLDSTLIESKSKMKFSRNPKDWKFVELVNPESPKENPVNSLDALLQLFKNSSMQSQQANIVIFSNQGGVITKPTDSKSCTNLLSKLQNVLEVIEQSFKEQDCVEFMNHIWIYCSPKMPSSLKKKSSKPNAKTIMVSKKNIFKKQNLTKEEDIEEIKLPLSQELLFAHMRKPEIGMFEMFQQDMNNYYHLKNGASEDIKLEFYCGDAAGRPTDFSDSDLELANNLQTEFLTPEEFMIRYTDKKSV
ncbi:hypothetical protein ACO0QE_001291 [Hanseniaspora vineae]